MGNVYSGNNHNQFSMSKQRESLARDLNATRMHMCTITYHVVMLYTAERQISMLFIDTECVFCL